MQILQRTINPKKWLKNKIKSIPGVMFVKNKLIDKKKKITKTEAFVGYFNNRKYIFIGQLSRIGYRLNIDFVQSDEEARKLEAGDYESGETCTYMTTWHEHWKCNVPDDNKYEVRWAQDGYLPPNYSHKDYFLNLTMLNIIVGMSWERICLEIKVSHMN